MVGDIDALPAVSKTEERVMHFLFSQPYFYFKRVIVTQKTETDIIDIDDLASLAVAVQRNSSHHSYLLSYPNINLSLYDSVEAALASVSSGTERVFIGNLATTDYLVCTNALTNLKFIVFEAEKEQSLHDDIISMAHNLGHYVIAEGVEYEKQKQYLQRHGCDKIQGYLISKPLDEDAAIEFLKKINNT